MNGTDLLTAFRTTRSEEAFSELARRYTNLVYSVAKRRLSSAALAEEVAQTVFTRLAAKPPKTRSDAELVAWLHRTTVYVAIDAWRSETRRCAREQQAAVMEPAPTDNSALWKEVRPMLDEALNQLSGADRQTLLLRFFDQKPMRDVGRILGVSEDAAKMRVSRAMDRLRTELGARGVTCPAVALSLVLAEKSIEAAPIQVLGKLCSIKAPAAAGVTALGIAGSLLQVSKTNLAAGAAVLILVVSTLVTFIRSMTTASPAKTMERSEINRAYGKQQDRPARPFLSRRSSSVGVYSAVREPVKVKLLLRVVDGESGTGLPKTKIRAVYFYAGGRPEGHDLVTDETGAVGIPEPSAANDHGMNVFVTAEGHVPKSTRFDAKDARTEYTMKLERGRSVGGLIVDDQGRPLAGVKVQVQGEGNKNGAAENVDFQTSAVLSDADGRWLCTCIPKDYQEVQFILTRDDLAVTLPIVPVSKVDLTKLVFVMDPGFAVTGRITDGQGQPIADAQVKELNNSGYRRQSSITDENGVFTLRGVAEYDSFRPPDLGTTESGSVVIRGMAGIGEPYLKLVVQADGFAPQSSQVKLVSSTNTVNFTLAKGRIFRGRLMDEAGHPIPDATVRTDSDNQGLRKYEWTARTDADGRFEWDSAPAEPVLFWFEADGFKWLRDIALAADGSEHEIKLTRASTDF